MGDFQSATAVTRQHAGSTLFDVSLDPQWTIDTKLHGGYLLAVLGRAAAEMVPHRQLTAISASFSVSPSPGPAVVHTEELHAGRSLTQVRARLEQHGVPCVEALITQGTLTDGDPWWSGAAPIDIPPEQDCFLLPAELPQAGFRVGLMEVVEQRLDPRTLGFVGGRPSRCGVIASWQRLAHGADWDPVSLLVALDPVPPVSYDLGISGLAPTVQFTAYVRRLPAPGPVRVRWAAGDVGGDRMDETIQVWDSKDRIVAHATQLAAVRTPT